jgi:DNA-binding NtrC family response regulator
MRARHEPGRVLVVEDEDAIAQLLGLLVERGGGVAVLAGSLTEARQLNGEGGFDAAIVDKNLPDGSGVELLRELDDVPVLVVTGYATADSASEALRLGAFDYIVKPFDIAWVARRIEIAVEHRRLRAEVRELRARLSAP